jgi:hypothetical protein
LAVGFIDLNSSAVGERVVSQINEIGGFVGSERIHINAFIHPLRIDDIDWKVTHKLSSRANSPIWSPMSRDGGKKTRKNCAQSRSSASPSDISSVPSECQVLVGFIFLFSLLNILAVLLQLSFYFPVVLVHRTGLMGWQESFLQGNKFSTNPNFSVFLFF